QVLYDGLCPICVTEIRFLHFLNRNQAGKVDFIDIAKPGYDAAKYKDVTYEMAMEEMHVIDEKDEGQVHRGVPAFAVMYGAVGLNWLARLMMWSPVRPLMDKSYAVFARNRLKWTGRGDECTTGRCEKKTN
uniref:Si:ch73-390p7.2 n=1 Tax=Oryzias latipes TaxID=8090 RepID=A0A3B3HKT6_ORYLA